MNCFVSKVYKNDPRIFFNPTLEDDRPGSFLVRQWEHSPVPFLIAMSSAEGLIESGSNYQLTEK